LQISVKAWGGTRTAKHKKRSRARSAFRRGNHHGLRELAKHFDWVKKQIGTWINESEGKPNVLYAKKTVKEEERSTKNKLIISKKIRRNGEPLKIRREGGERHQDIWQHIGLLTQNFSKGEGEGAHLRLSLRKEKRLSSTR